MYQVLITTIEEVECVERKYQRIADSGNEEDGGPIYDYVESPTTKEVETIILQQTLEVIDLPEIIKAVNKIQ